MSWDTDYRFTVLNLLTGEPICTMVPGDEASEAIRQSTIAPTGPSKRATLCRVLEALEIDTKPYPGDPEYVGLRVFSVLDPDYNGPAVES